MFICKELGLTRTELHQSSPIHYSMRKLLASVKAELEEEEQKKQAQKNKLNQIQNSRR